MAKKKTPSAGMTDGVREKRPGYWEVRAYVGYDPDTGKRIVKTKGVSGTRRDALRKKAELEASIEENYGAPSGDPTLRQLFDDVLEHLISLDRSENTIVSYSEHMETLINGLWRPLKENGKFVVDPDFTGCECDLVMKNCWCKFQKELVVAGIGNLRLSKVTPQLMQRFYGRLGKVVGAARVTRYHATFRRSFNLAINWNLTTGNPVLRTERNTPTKRVMRRPTDAEVAELVGAAFQLNDAKGMAVQLACMAGPRRGEVTAARWRNLTDDTLLIDDAARIAKRKGLTVDNGTKSHAEREITLDDFTVELLRLHRERMEKRAEEAGVELHPDAFILSDAPDGMKPWRPDRLTKLVTKLRATTSYQARFQDLRGWSLSAAFDDGIELADVVRRGGWGNAATFLTYYLRSAGKNDAAAASKIGDRLAAARELQREQRAANDELAARRSRRAS